MSSGETHVQRTFALTAATRCSVDRNPSWGRRDPCQHHSEKAEGEREQRSYNSIEGDRDRRGIGSRAVLRNREFRLFLSANEELAWEVASGEWTKPFKAAQAEAKAKAKIAVKKDTSKPDAAKPAVAAEPAEIARSKPAVTGSLFDVPAAVVGPPAHSADTDEEEEILAEVSEEGQADDDEELDEVAWT
jgi:hypothetical protein